MISRRKFSICSFKPRVLFSTRCVQCKWSNSVTLHFWIVLVEIFIFFKSIVLTEPIFTRKKSWQQKTSSINCDVVIAYVQELMFLCDIERRNLITWKIYLVFTGILKQFFHLWIFQGNFSFVLICLVWNHAATLVPSQSKKKKSLFQAGQKSTIIVVFTFKVRFK